MQIYGEISVFQNFTVILQDLTNRTVMKKYLLLFLVGLGGACTSPDFSEQYSENEKNRIDSIVYAGRNIDTLPEV